ncbi:MAG: Ku protein [Acidimicrobiia bacterium]|nr:Ku protein [Acidimicrobiia bacterium]MDH5521574.1 Ku protein [Acidimicrobiia bacterium]
MPRAIWSGAISFGLVSVPVKLYTAVSRKSVRFNQIDAKTNSRVKQKRVNAEGDEVSYEQIVKGYEISKDSYVIVTEDELAALSPKASRMIDITDFVLESQIDPVFYDAAYFLVPDELARKSYTLLSRAMEDSGRVAIATFVMRTKQYLVAIRPTDGRLMMSTMVYADELVSPEEIPGLEELDEIEVSNAEMAMAGQLIESLATDFEPDQYRDSYREQVLDLLEQKASGEIQSIEAAPAAEEAAVVDLLAALEASVNAAKEARKKPAKKAGKKAAKKAGKTADKGADDEAEHEAKSA